MTFSKYFIYLLIFLYVCIPHDFKERLINAYGETNQDPFDFEHVNFTSVLNEFELEPL